MYRRILHSPPPPKPSENCCSSFLGLIQINAIDVFHSASRWAVGMRSDKPHSPCTPPISLTTWTDSDFVSPPGGEPMSLRHLRLLHFKSHPQPFHPSDRSILRPSHRMSLVTLTLRKFCLFFNCLLMKGREWKCRRLVWLKRKNGGKDEKLTCIFDSVYKSATRNAAVSYI